MKARPSDVLYHQRGAVTLHHARIRLLALEFSGNWWATWPLGKIECRAESLTFKAWPAKVSIRLQDIEVAEVKSPDNRLSVVRLSEYLEIRHRAGLPNPITFTSSELSPVVSFLQQRGVKVVTK
jgi:hypothetical protein